MASLSGYEERAIKKSVIELLERELTDMNSLVEIVRLHLSPEDVFPVRELEEWAEENGYVKGLADMGSAVDAALDSGE